MDIKNFKSAIAQIAEEKGISVAKVMEAIEAAVAAAYKKDYGKKGQIIKAQLAEDGSVKFWQIRTVVSPDMVYSDEELEALKESKVGKSGQARQEEKIRFNPEKHIMLDEAKKIKPNINVGEELKVLLKTQKDYGRIAAQTAKQVILQKIREAEREMILQEYKSKEGELVSGIVQRVEGKNVYIDIGKTLGILPKEEQVYGEFYRPGQRLKTYVLKVEETSKGPVVFLSRAYPKVVSKLFELEVPEIAQGSVVIRSIAREPGSRSKIALESKEEGIDPIGSAVGQKGTRVMAVINELGGEKIDIVEYSDDPKQYIANALSPAKVLEVKIMSKNKAVCVVAEDQLSLAIGKDGQNVRLAAKLTGWKIDVRPQSGTETEDIAEPDKEQGEVAGEKNSIEGETKKDSDKTAGKPEDGSGDKPKSKETEKGTEARNGKTGLTGDSSQSKD